MKRRGGRKSHRPGAGERLGGGVKRRAEPGMPSEATSSGVPPSMAAAAAAEGGAGMEPDELEFEDPFIDEEDADEDGQVIEEDHVFADDPDKLNIDLSEGTDGAVVKVFRPGIDVVPEGDKLEYSAEAYVMYHAMSADWPCLSVDVVPDLLGMARTKMPLTTFFVAGTQADTPKNNSLLVLKASNLVRTQHDEDEDVVDLDEEDDPVLEIQSIPHYGGINRVRVMPQAPHVVSVWSDQGVVELFDIRHRLSTLDIGAANAFPPPTGYQPGAPAPKDPVFVFSGHASEGFAMGWSPVTPGRLATGDCARFMYVWDAEAGSAVTGLGSGPPKWSWAVSNVPYTGHTASVEDISWSPTEATVLASCGVDGTVRIWDTRDASKSQLHVQVSDVDVNVIDWNSARAPFLLAAGADNGEFTVWDLRMVKAQGAAANFAAKYSWHTEAISSIRWDPHDESVLAVAAADNTVTVWDLSMEADTEQALAGTLGAAAAAQGGSGGAATDGLDTLPPQLLFVHQGQNDLREVTFHPQVPGMLLSTAGDGFNLWKPDIDVTAEPDEEGDTTLVP